MDRLNPSTRHEIGGWIESQAFRAKQWEHLHFFCVPSLNFHALDHQMPRPGWNNMGYLSDVPGAATIDGWPQPINQIWPWWLGWVPNGPGNTCCQHPYAPTICLHSFLLFPMPPSANPGRPMGKFRIVRATCNTFKCSHYKRAGCNPSTLHETGDSVPYQAFQAIHAASICHPFAYFHFASNATQCQPWPFNGKFGNSMGYS